MKTRILVSMLLFIALSITGCRKPQKIQYDKQLPPGQLALRKITNPAEIPDFTAACQNVSNLALAVDNSLHYLNKPSSKKFYPYGDISHQEAMDSLRAFRKLLDSGLRGRQLNNAIRDQFDVYVSIGCDDNGTVLFTGYYTPIFDGSPTPTDKFKYPLYKLPEDLVKGPEGEILGRKGPDGQMTKYPPRAEIESSNMFKGKELVWMSNPFEVYIAHVQGSAKLRYPDGKLVTVGYAANNGYEYHSISEELVKAGKIPREKLSLSAMIDYFRTNPGEISNYINMNPRFVFFRLEEGPPRGSINEPVTTLRTIATDKSIYPRACLAFLTTTLPREVGGNIYQDPYDGFALDQDSGGAIRAPGRCDVYMGQGETAGRLAGQTYKEGKLYYIFVKPEFKPVLVPPPPPKAGSNPEPTPQK
jgi:membrane-bound lytic murein transglycosylase A